MVHNWVSEFLLGPALSTTRLMRQQFEYPLGIGWSEKLLDVICGILKAWKLHEAPFLLSEDGTSLQHRLDIASEGDAVYLFGLNGGSIQVKLCAQSHYRNILYCATRVSTVAQG